MSEQFHNNTSSKDDKAGTHIRSLGVLQLLAISFFTVSGGPYGIEDIVATAPIAIVLLSFIVIPIVWSTPVALITAELSTMIPDDGGSVLWVKNGFGDAVGWINGICSWLVFLLDSALYPTVMLTYVVRLTGDLHPAYQLLLTSAFVFIALCVNLRSALEVGWLAEALGFLSLLPFIVFVICAFTSGSVGHVDLHNFKDPKVDLGLLISLSIWNSAGWEDVGMLAGEVKNPSRTFPIGLVSSLLLQTFCNIIPISVGYAVDPNYENWVTGYFSYLARKVGGEWVYVLMLVGAFVSNFGLMHANIVNSSRLVGWMAMQKKDSRPWFPPIFGKLYTDNKIPRMAVALNCIIIAILTALPFETLVQADVLLMCASYIFIFLTFCILRYKSPGLARPFALPTGKSYPVLISSFYIVIPIAMVVLQAVTSPWLVIAVGGGCILASIIMYIIVFVILKGGLHKYSEVPSNPQTLSVTINVS